MIFQEKRNFLEPEFFKNKFGILNGSNNFPWFYSKNTAYEAAIDDQHLWDFSYSHTLFVNDSVGGEIGELCVKMTDEICRTFDLTLEKLIRIRAGMITKTPVSYVHEAHVDYPYEHITALFYLTTCNGPTILYNQKFPNNLLLTEARRIVPEENKIVLFEGLQYHSSSSQTDTKQRIVINFNFTVK